MTAQLAFPMPLQPRAHRKEDLDIYYAIVWLRRHGHAVQRCGAGRHRLNGAQLSTAELKGIVATLIEVADSTPS